MKRVFILILFIVVLFMSGCEKKQVVGGDEDEHGCIGSAGYRWCPSQEKCMRMWEEYCEEYSSEYIGNLTNTTNNESVGNVTNLTNTTNNPVTGNVTCFFDSECEGKSNSTYRCELNERWKDSTAKKCFNPGELNSFCGEEIGSILIETCQYGCNTSSNSCFTTHQG